MTKSEIVAAFTSELNMLQRRFVSELKGISERAAGAAAAAESHDIYSTHAPFNLAANCQDLQAIAAKIEHTKMTLSTLAELTEAV